MHLRGPRRERRSDDVAGRSRRRSRSRTRAAPCGFSSATTLDAPRDVAGRVSRRDGRASTWRPANCARCTSSASPATARRVPTPTSEDRRAGRARQDRQAYADAGPVRNRFLTLVLAAGAAVLLLAIVDRRADGRSRARPGDRARNRRSAAASRSPRRRLRPRGPYGPDWKRSQTLAVGHRTRASPTRASRRSRCRRRCRPRSRRRPSSPHADPQPEHPDLAPAAAADRPPSPHRPDRSAPVRRPDSPRLDARRHALP